MGLNAIKCRDELRWMWLAHMPKSRSANFFPLTFEKNRIIGMNLRATMIPYRASTTRPAITCARDHREKCNYRFPQIPQVLSMPKRGTHSRPKRGTRSS